MIGGTNSGKTGHRRQARANDKANRRQAPGGVRRVLPWVCSSPMRSSWGGVSAASGRRSRRGVDLLSIAEHSDRVMPKINVVFSASGARLFTRVPVAHKTDDT